MRHARQALEKIRALLAGRTKVHASLYYASSSLVCQTMRLCGIIVSTRLIAKAQFGLFAQGMMAFTLTSLLRDIGQNTALVSYRERDRRYAVFSFQLNAALGLLASVLLWIVLAAAPGIPDELRRAAPFLAFATLADSLQLTGNVMMQKEFRFGMLARVEIGAVAAWLGTVAATVTRMEGCMTLFAAQLAEFVFRFIAVFASSGWRYVGWSGGSDLKRYYLGKFARHLVPQIILQTLTARLDYLLLTFLSTRNELGIYERMLQYIRIPWSLSINLMDRVLLASYSREQDDPAALRKTLRESTLLVGAAVVATAGAATLAVAFALKFFVGPDWARTILNHWWGALPFILITPFVWNLNLFCQGTGRAAQLLRNTVCLLVATAIGGLLAVPKKGACGMLLAQGAGYAALLVYQFRAIRRSEAQGA